MAVLRKAVEDERQHLIDYLVKEGFSENVSLVTMSNTELRNLRAWHLWDKAKRRYEES